MITLTKNGNAIVFTFSDNAHYLFDGTIEVPVNSLTLITDNSQMATFKKSASNDIFISATYAELGMSKSELESWFKENACGSTGGGGVTSGEVETMIETSLEDYYDIDEVDTALGNKADTSAVTESINAAVSGKADTSAFTAYSAATDARLAEDEEVTAAALNDLNDALSGKADTSAVTAVANDVSTLSGAVEDAGAYYINFATIATTGIRDEDWDGIVAAIDGHRPIYAGYPRTDGGILYYGVECMNKNGNNTQIILTSSDDNSHYFYAFTKNGSNDYTFTSETRPYTTQAEKDAWNTVSGKVETSAITSAITSASTNAEVAGAKAVYDAIQAGGGGGATYSAGTNISIDTANTINCTLPITANTNNLQGYLLFGSNISVWGSESNGRYQIAIGKQISNPAYAQGQVAICPADTSSSSLSELTGDYPIGIGHRITSRGNGAVAIGDRANANGNNYVALGTANATGTTKMNLNNQIKVDTNNQVYIKDKTNTTDVCIQDAIAALGGLKLVKLTQAEYDALATKDANTLYIISNVVS